MVRVAMRQSARTAQELEKESLALQEKRSALLMQNGYPKDYLDPIYSCPRCRDTGWTDREGSANASKSSTAPSRPESSRPF